MEQKLAVVGSGGVGKSALVIQLLKNHFVDEYDPTIEDSYRMQVTVDNETNLLDILDTAGDEEPSEMREQYMKKSDAMLFVYSVTSQQSFDLLESFYIAQARRIRQEDHVPGVLVGNKVDITDRVISQTQGKALAEKYNMQFFETSAKTRLNVEDAFNQLVREARKVNGAPSYMK
jgi:GTPase KRas protein